MPSVSRSLFSVLLSLSLATGAFGCAAAAVGAGAGAAGAIAYTDRGAKGEVKGDVQKVSDRARSSLQDMGIHLTDTEVKQSGKEQKLTGKAGDTTVEINMTSQSPETTSVEVVARKGAMRWDKDYARDVLSKIVAEG